MRRFTAVALFFVPILLTSGVLAEEKPPPGERGKFIALTFDGGPKPILLDKLLPLLEKHKVQATFFVVGKNAARHPDYLGKMRRLGHEVENHSWSHDDYVRILKTKKSSWREWIKDDLGRTAQAIFQATGKRPRFFRPPYHSLNAEIERAIIGEGYRVLKFRDPDVVTYDYEDDEKQRPAAKLIKRVKRIVNLREASDQYTHSLVFHELAVTVEALETLIPYFKNQGYLFVRIDRLFLENGQ